MPAEERVTLCDAPEWDGTKAEELNYKKKNVV